MRIDLAENISIQLEKMAGKNFRTPKLQLEFILSRIFADGFYNENAVQPVVKNTHQQSYVDLRDIAMHSALLEKTDTVSLEGDKNSSDAIDIMYAEASLLAEQHLADERDNTGWQNSREAFEKANSEKAKTMPKLSEEDLKAISEAHEKRVIERKKNNSIVA